MERTDLSQRADEGQRFPSDGWEGQEVEARRIEAARGGDREAFDGLVRDHYGPVYATAFRLIGNHEDAEDLAQECFARAYGALAWYRHDGPFAAWLRRIVVHLAHDRFRAAGRRPESHGVPLEPGRRAARAEHSATSPRGEREPALAAGLTPASQAGAQELTRLLGEALRRLPAHLRIPLVLRTLEGLDYDEIARATGVTPATARTQVMKARRALRRLLAPYLREDGA